jgi:Fic family protein
MGLVYETPELQPVELEVLAIIAEERDKLARYVDPEPRRWSGTLRRMSFARAVQASNSIEGYDASLDDVIAAVDSEPTLSTGEETRYALEGYRDAMTYVLQVALDRGAKVDEGLLKSLHFMMLRHRLDKSPGRWREGPVFVVREQTGEQMYEGPGYEQIPRLIAEMVSELETSDAPVLVRAAMAHLNLVMIHPFRDGNGRMARALQTLVLAREQLMAPVFWSIEEYLGRNTQSYYDILAAAGQGGWNPQHDARAWLQFCLRAHFFQVRTQLRRIEETERLYHACSDLAAGFRLPERVVGGLVESAFGLRVTHASYKTIVEITDGEQISSLTASRDLRSMVDAKLLQPIGQTRGRHYVSEPVLEELRRTVQATRVPKETSDPFELALSRRQLTFET